MALGPELIYAQAAEVSREFARSRVRRATAGDSWLALAFSSDRALLFSWDSEVYGVCRVTPGEIRELESASSSRPTLLDAVRSHIVGADLRSALRLNSDRLMDIKFHREIGAGFFQIRRVIFEASGRYSNFIILDDDGIVIEAAKHVPPSGNRYRTIIPGSRYAPPPQAGTLSLSEIAALNEITPPVLTKARGVGKPLIEAMTAMPEASVRSLLTCLENPGSRGYQVFPSAKYVTLADSPLPGAVALDAGDSLSAARCVVLYPLMGRGAASCKKKIASILKVSERANDGKIREYETLASRSDEIERLKAEGRLILENARVIPPRSSSATLTEWTDAGPVERAVSLDPARDASGNADARFAKYRRKKAAMEAAASLLPQLYKKRGEILEQNVLLNCNDDCNTLSLMLCELEKPSGDKSRGKPKVILPPHKRTEFGDGAVVFCGLSAKGNRYVTFKLAKADDLWLHASGIPGAHVILRFGAKPDPDTLSRMIAIAASCAVFYSGARRSGGVRVDYAERKHVRAIQGETANVTYKEFQSVIADSSLWSGLDAYGPASRYTF